MVAAAPSHTGSYMARHLLVAAALAGSSLAFASTGGDGKVSRFVPRAAGSGSHVSPAGEHKKPALGPVDDRLIRRHRGLDASAGVLG